MVSLRSSILETLDLARPIEYSSPMSPESIRIANKTSRSGGAVSAKAIVPRYVASIACPSLAILDFGAGKDAVHTKRLRSRGLNVTAHDFGGNFHEGTHDGKALLKQYDIVFASNVINTLDNGDALWETFYSLWQAVRPGGRLVMNYPESPRKLDASPNMIKLLFAIVTGHTLTKVGGTKRAPIWEAVK